MASLHYKKLIKLKNSLFICLAKLQGQNLLIYLYNNLIISLEMRINCQNVARFPINKNKSENSIDNSIFYEQEASEVICLNGDQVDLLQYGSKEQNKPQLQNLREVSKRTDNNSQYLQVYSKPTNEQGSKDINYIITQKYPQNHNDPKRTSNFIATNVVRSVKHCLKDMLKSQESPLYAIIQAFIKQFSMKGQIWAFDAILACLLYLKDETGLLKKKKYNSILQLMSSRLSTLTNKSRGHQFKTQQFQLFKQHLRLYQDQEFNYSKLVTDHGYKLREDFFYHVLVTRKTYAQGFSRIIRTVHDRLQKGQFFGAQEKRE